MKFSKKLKAISLATAIVTLPSINSSQAEEYKKGIYLNLGAGTGSYSDIGEWTTDKLHSLDFGFNWEAGIGYDFGKTFRTEVSYVDTTSERSGGKDIDFSSIMFNTFLDFPIKNTKYTPFVSVGFGSTNFDGQSLCGKPKDCKEDGVSTFSFGGGVSYAINERTELFGKATYYDYEDITIKNGGSNVKVNDHRTVSLNLGAIIRF